MGSQSWNNKKGLIIRKQ